MSRLFTFLNRSARGFRHRLASRWMANHRFRRFSLLRPLPLRASHVDEQGQGARLQEAVRPVRLLQTTPHRRPHFLQLLPPSAAGARSHAA